MVYKLVIRLVCSVTISLLSREPEWSAVAYPTRNSPSLLLMHNLHSVYGKFTKICQDAPLGRARMNGKIAGILGRAGRTGEPITRISETTIQNEQASVGDAPTGSCISRAIANPYIV